MREELKAQYSQPMKRKIHYNIHFKGCSKWDVPVPLRIAGIYHFFRFRFMGTPKLAKSIIYLFQVVGLFMTNQINNFVTRQHMHDRHAWPVPFAF